METASIKIQSRSNVRRRPPLRASSSIGRLSVVFAILAFAACYWHGIVSYGLIAGFCLGWIPSSVLAWLVFSGTIAIAPVFVRVIKYLILPDSKMS